MQTKYMHKKVGLLFLATIMFLNMIVVSSIEAKAAAIDPNTLQKGDIVYFGLYPKTEIGTTEPPEGAEGVDWVSRRDVRDSNQQKYYSIKPIEWSVLSTTDNELFLITEDSIDSKAYCSNYDGSEWIDSEVRPWLNKETEGGFIAQAFSDVQRSVIKTVYNQNYNNDNFTSGGTPTNDKVFLLSYPEAKNSTYFTGNTKTLAKNTDYAMAAYQIHYTPEQGNVYYWLRSKTANRHATYVDKYGNVLSGDENTTRSLGIRPAVKLNLTQLTIEASGTIKVNIPESDISVTPYNGEYDGGGHSITVSDSGGGTITYSTTADGVYTDVNPQYANAGTYTTYFKVNRGGDSVEYSDSSTVTITKKPLANSMIGAIAAETYTGSPIEPALTVTDSVYLTSSDYTVGYAGNTNAGTATATITATETGNYSGTVTANFTINKAFISDANQTFEVAENTAHGYTFDLTTLLPGNMNVSGVAYAPSIISNDDGLLETSLNYTSGSSLTIPVLAVDDAGKTATIKVTVSSDNYHDFDADITVRSIEKTAVTISGITIEGGEYNGSPHSYVGTPIFTSALGGSAVAVSGFDVRYESTDGRGYSGTTAPVNAGAYVLTISVAGTDIQYAGSHNYSFTISPKTVTVRADDQTIKQGEPLPAPTVSYLGYISPDDETNTLSTQAVARLHVSDSNTAGTTVIDFQTQSVLESVYANYTLNHINGILTINALSTESNLLNVITPSNAAVTGTNITARVANNVTSQVIDVAVSDEATWKLYSDALGTDEIANQTMTLNVGTNTAYIKVTAENGLAYTIYQIDITRASAGGGGGNGGSGGSSDGGDSSSGGTPQPQAPTEVIKQAQTDRAIEAAIEAGEKPVIAIDGKTKGAEISADQLLANQRQGNELLLVNQGQQLSLSPQFIEALDLQDKSAAKVVINFALSQQAINSQTAENLMRVDPLNQTLAGQKQEIDIHVDEQSVGRMSQPIKVTVDVSELNLTDAQKANFSGVLYDTDGKIARQLGGEFSADGKTFSYYTYQTGEHGVIVSGNLKKLQLQIGSKEYTVNGEQKSNDVSPVIEEGRTLLPLRSIAEALEAAVEWNNETKTVAIMKNGKTVYVVIGEELPGGMGTAVIRDGRTLVPLRYIAEQLGANVVWDAATKQVSIYQ